MEHPITSHPVKKEDAMEDSQIRFPPLKAPNGLNILTWSPLDGSTAAAGIHCRQHLHDKNHHQHHSWGVNCVQSQYKLEWVTTLELSRIVEPKNSQPTLELALGCKSNHTRSCQCRLNWHWDVEVITQEAASALGMCQMNVLRRSTVPMTCHSRYAMSMPLKKVQ